MIRRMPKNTGHGTRLGEVDPQQQARDANEQSIWTRRDTVSGRFVTVKANGGAFKGVRRPR